MSALLPDITIRQLEYLLAVDTHPTWATAAAAVGVSPSALSQGLAELERRLGVALFESVGRRRVLRATAAPVVEHARLVVTQTHDLVAWADRLRRAASGTVRLGMIDVAAVDHFPQVVRRFREERPDVELTLTVAPSASLIDGLLRGAHDLVVCVDPGELPAGIEAEPLLTEPLVIYAPPDTDVTAADGRRTPWVLFPAGSHTRSVVEQELRRRDGDLVVAAESHQPDVLREMVLLGLGRTVLPPSQGDAERLVAGDVVVERTLVLARRRAAVPDPAADELGRRLVAAARDSRPIRPG